MNSWKSRFLQGLIIMFSVLIMAAQLHAAAGITRIASGDLHTLALKSDGTLIAWGNNDYGYLGDGSTTYSSSPVSVTGLSGVTDIAAGHINSLALTSNGKVYAWGTNVYGQLGISEGAGNWTIQPIPTEVPGLSGITAIASGNFHAVALASDGKVWTWGMNTVGQFGHNINSSYGSNTPSPTPTEVPGLSGVIAIAVNTLADFTVALKNDGTVVVWGMNGAYMLGNTGTWVNGYTPFAIDGLSGITAIAAGNNHILALKSNGTVYAWGYNSSGDLGPNPNNPNNDHSSIPLLVSGLSEVTAIAAGQYHSVALKSNGEVWSWGDNNYGQLGNSTNYSTTWPPNPTPLQVTGLSGAIAISSASWAGTWALKSDGTAWRWGQGDYGNGGSYVIRNYSPTQLTKTLGVLPNAGIGGCSSAVLKSDGTVWSWGCNNHGQMGNGAINSTTYKTPVQSLSNVAKLSAGWHYTVALKSNGTVWAWGNNGYGQVGNGQTTDVSTPVQVLTGVIDIAAGSYHTVALKADGTVWTWGWNQYGQIGDGSSTNRNTPAQVTGISGVVAISAGWARTVALKSDGTVWNWGNYCYGQLGIEGYPTNYKTPQPVPYLSGNLDRIVAISAGDHSTAALKDDGTVFTWGHNEEGELGNGTISNHVAAPTAVAGLSNVVAIASGSRHVLALKGDGTVVSWGENEYGELGNGTITNSSSPVTVTGLSNVRAVFASAWHSAALKSDGTYWAWGSNGTGQIGIGTVDYNTHPLPVQSIIAMNPQFPYTRPSPLGGTYHSTQTVTLTPDRSATIYYTIDGTTPTYPANVNTYIYSYPLSIFVNTTLKFMARDNSTGFLETVKTQNYIINSTTSLDVFIRGLGAGCVTENGSGPCRNVSYTTGATVGSTITLTPTADTGSYFAGWSNCFNVNGTTNTCTLTMNSNSNVLAVFNATVPMLELSITPTGNGSGSIGYSTGGSCAGSCIAKFTSGTTVQLTAAASVGSQFNGWSFGCDSVAGAVCTVNVNSKRSVTPNFTLTAQAPNQNVVLLMDDSSPTGASGGFIFESRENTGMFEVSIDGSSWTTSTSELNFNNLADGTHILSVRAMDQSGVVTSNAITYTWNVDAFPVRIGAILLGSISSALASAASGDAVMSRERDSRENVVHDSPTNVKLVGGCGLDYVSSIESRERGASTTIESLVISKGSVEVSGITIGSAASISSGS